MSYKKLETPERDYHMYAAYKFVFELKGKIIDSFIKAEQYKLSPDDIVKINDVLGVINSDGKANEAEEIEIETLRNMQGNHSRYMSQDEFDRLKELLYKNVSNETRTKRKS